MNHSSLYETDFYAWTQQQARLLSDHNLTKIDVENLIEEVMCMGRSEKRALQSRLEVLLVHLLKWQYQKELRSKSWTLSIKEQRLKAKEVLEENPSLNQKLNSCITGAYKASILGAALETGLPEKTFPKQCPWSKTDILDNQFFPE